MPWPDLKKRINAKTLCERAEQIRKYGFPSHELCYWNCGDYRVRCDQIGSKDECIGPKLFVEINDPTECIQGGVHEFDVIATANHTIAFPKHLDRIRDRNTAAEKEKKETASLKRAKSPTSTTRLSKRPFSCSSQSKSAPSARTATTWQPTSSQASSSRDFAVYDGGCAAS